jgi:hypothetical protein
MFSFLVAVAANVVLFTVISRKIKSFATAFLVYMAIAIPVDAFIDYCLNPSIAHAAIEPFKVDAVWLTGKQFMPNGFSPYMVDGPTLNKELDLHFNAKVLKVGYFDNMVWSLVDQSQFRWVGWNYKLGVHTLPFLDVEYEHFSRHILDAKDPFQTHFSARYPVEDSINVNLYLLRPTGTDSLL